MSKKYHLVYYVTQRGPKLRKFKSIKEMNAFIENFENSRPNKNDFWIDFSITNIMGTLSLYEEFVDYEE